jgi:ribosomal protein S18 acetylase RimI-like enzyme
MYIVGPLTSVRVECERVLRTLPRWFGIEGSLLEYALNTTRMPTFVAKNGAVVVGFLSLQEHFPGSWEVNCIAIDMAYRGQGLGRELHRTAEDWLASKRATILQVKTLAPSHTSLEYAETRRFYDAIGYQALEVFPNLWGEHLPVLQLVKPLPGAAQAITQGEPT